MDYSSSVDANYVDMLFDHWKGDCVQPCPSSNRNAKNGAIKHAECRMRKGSMLSEISLADKSQIDAWTQSSIASFFSDL